MPIPIWLQLPSPGRSHNLPHAVAITRTPRSRKQSSANTKAHAFTVLDKQSPQLLLDDRLGTITTLNAAAIRPVIDRVQDIQQAGHSLPLLASDGPSFTRSMSRYADGQHDLAIAKLVATLLFTTRAESLLYYGQELGVPRALHSTYSLGCPATTHKRPTNRFS